MRHAPFLTGDYINGQNIPGHPGVGHGHLVDYEAFVIEHPPSNVASNILNRAFERAILEWAEKDIPALTGKTLKLTACCRLSSDNGAAWGAGFTKRAVAGVPP